jgi:hypothetical protein
MKQAYPRLLPAHRPDPAVGEWLAAMVRGLDALAFLERSRDLAAEPVLASAPRLTAPRQVASRHKQLDRPSDRDAPRT